MKKQVWKIRGKGSPVLEIWEDFYGNLWFVTEHIDDRIKFGYVRLYAMPENAEWGTFDVQEIKEAVGEHKVWNVKEKDWKNIESYEKGLLIPIEQETNEAIQTENGGR